MITAILSETILRDFIYALRTMRKAPVFAVTAMITLALGIGANTAIFSVVHAVLLKPLEYQDPNRLVHLSGGATLAHFEEIKAGKSFRDVGAFAIGTENMTLSDGGEPEALKAARVSANFLNILGVEPMVGRSFLPEEDAPGSPAVAMISAELWQRRFNGDRHIIGKTVTLAAAPCTVVGVLPPGFQFPFAQLDAWVNGPSEWSAMSAQSRRISPFLAVFGRLNPGVSLDQASAELAVIQRQYAMAHPAMLDAKPKSAVRARLWQDELVAKVRSMLWMLFGAVGFVLLIACANVASLLLARATSRSREFAIRSALGAGRTRLMVQLLAESLVLSTAGGALGLVLSAWILRAASHTNTLDLPRATEIHLDDVVLGFAAVLSIVTGMLFGLVPSLGASRLDLMRVLRISSEAVGRSAERLRVPFTARGMLVIGQVALSIVLLIGASLMIESVLYLRQMDPGFSSANLLTMQISLPPLRYNTDQKKTAFFEDLVRRVDLLPGVREASLAFTLPMTTFPGTPVQDAAKPPLKLNERPIATALIVMPGYFRTLGIRFRSGRDFTERDTAAAQRVAIIDEDLARRFWPSYPRGQNPIGQRLLVGGVNRQPAEIVGIVAHVHQNLEDNAWRETVYVSFAQSPQSQAMLAVRTRWSPMQFTEAIRRELRRLDRDQSITALHTMDDLVEAQLGQRRSLMLLLGSFAGLAVLLAAIGLYGLIAYSVARRTREMGIRRALGALEGDILSLVVRQGLGLTVAGVAIGIAGAFGLTRFLRGLLFHISNTDPVIFIGVPLVFILVATLASYIPARRAVQVDPMTALRHE